MTDSPPPDSSPTDRPAPDGREADRVSWRAHWARRATRLGRHRSVVARTRGAGWRLLTPVGFIAVGALLVTSAVNSEGTDLRPDSRTDLADLAEQETARVQRLQATAADLTTEIEELSGEQTNRALTRIQERIDSLEEPAGLTAVEGPGVTVTLNDAPREVRQSASDDDVNETIVHQQDIQAVVNALWRGGAEAMTINGQRVVSTTGIKCIGNTVLLHGVTYSPPYVISAIGDQDAMRASLDTDNYIRAYLVAVDEWQLGWDLSLEERIEAPAYEGSMEMRFARPPAELDPDDGR